MDVSDPSQMSRAQRGSPARAVAAALTLAVLLLGVPLVLLRWGAWRELKDVARNPGLLLLPDDGHLVLAVMTAAGVIFWVVLAVCIVVEIIDAIRFRLAQRSGSRGLPQRVSGLRSLVRPLVTAIFAVAFVGSGLQATAVASPAAAQPAPIVSTTGAPVDRIVNTPGATGSGHIRSGPVSLNAQPIVSDHIVTVEPGDTLWSIAAEELGDGQRWTQIAEANPGLITDPGLIQPGWQVAMPDNGGIGDSTTGGAVVNAGAPSDAPTTPSQPNVTNDGQQRPGIWEQTAAPPGDASGTASSPDGGVPGQRASGSHEATITVVESASPLVDDSPSDPTEVGRSRSAAGVAGVSGLVATGLVVLLWRRRREQLRNRPVGRRILQPSDEGRRLEAALGVAGSYATMSKNMFRFDSMVSEIHDRESFELAMVNGLAENFTVLPLEAGGCGDVPENGVTVCVGEDEQAEAVCVRLEGVDPFLICAEQPETAGLVARGLAMNLAVGESSADVELHLVTAENLFATFDAVQCHGTFDEGVARLSQVVAERQSSLDNREWRTLRSNPDTAEAWRPVVFCFISTMSLADLSRLRQALSGAEVGVVTVAAITSPDLTSLESMGASPVHRLTVESLERAILHPSGEVVHPLMLEPTAALRELLQVSASQDVAQAWWSSTTTPSRSIPSQPGPSVINPGVPDPDTINPNATVRSETPAMQVVAESDSPPIPQIDAVSDADAAPEADSTSRPHRAERSATETAPYWPMSGVSDSATVFTQPTLMLLGPITLEGARGTPPPRAERACAECCGWLLEHPGTTATAMAQGLLVAEGTRRSNMSRLRRWLGSDPQGHSYLPEAYSGRIWLDVAVTSDWQRLCLLIKGGIEATTTDNLIQALKLVRGAPLADATPGQWHWSEELRTDMVSVIRDIGVVVTRRAIDLSDIDLARWAASRALVAAPEDELLLCVRAETEYAAGNRMEVERLVAWITRNSRNLGVDLLPETVAILKRVIGENPRQWAAVERLAPDRPAEPESRS